MNELESALHDLTAGMRSLEAGIRAMAPRPLDQMGAALDFRLSAFESKAGGGGPEAFRSPGHPVHQAPGQYADQLTAGGPDWNQPLTRYGGSRTLRKLEETSVSEWISAEILDYDRRQLREAVAKIRDMLRKLIQDWIRTVIAGVSHEQGPWLGEGEMSFRPQGRNPWSPISMSTRERDTSLRPQWQNAWSPISVALGSFGTQAKDLRLPLDASSSALPLDPTSLPHGSPTFESRKPRAESLMPAAGGQTSTDDPREVHFHIHDAAAVGPILRNRDAMLVRTAALVDRQRAIARRPRGR